MRAAPQRVKIQPARRAEVVLESLEPRPDAVYLDPMFVPEGRDETFGEMDPAQKHAISHRARAFDLLVKACFE